VLREFEDAIDDCDGGSIDNNYGSAHAWDEGVAFYTGSLEGQDGTGSGQMLHALADKRCKNFNTCGVTGTSGSGVSKVNLDIFLQFSNAQHFLNTNQCAPVRGVLDRVIELMAIPLIQGTLRYAYKVGISTNAKEAAEGATFAAAMLPLLHTCSATDAGIVYDNMRLGASATDTAAVKSALERNYACLGLTCADVGELSVDELTVGYSSVPCTDPLIEQTNTLSAGGIAGIVIALVLAVLFLICLCVLIIRERRGKPVFSNIHGAPEIKNAPKIEPAVMMTPV